MKKIFNSIFIIALTALSLGACDKIEEGNYIVFSGASGEWFDGEGVADHSQRALIEKYTGVRCVNCHDADVAINAALSQYGDKLLAVAIHDSCLAFTRPIGDSPDMRTPDGDTWSKYFGIFNGSYPAALVSRTTTGNAWDIFTPTSGINSRVDNVIGQQAKVAVEASAIHQTDAISITVNLEFMQTVSDDLTVTLFIMEDGIVATQRLHDGTDDENYVHNHVLRDVITDVWGADIDCTGNSGEKRYAVFSYKNFSQNWNLDNCHIVAFISNKSTREIINVAECEIK